MDFAYSIKRIADVKVGSGGYWAFRGKIAGLDAFRAGSQCKGKTDYDVEVEGLRAVGTHELEIRLTAPYPQLPWILAMPYAYAVPREAVAHVLSEFLQLLFRHCRLLRAAHGTTPIPSPSTICCLAKSSSGHRSNSASVLRPMLQDVGRAVHCAGIA